MTMDSRQVHGRIEELLYAIQFDRDLGDPARREFIARGIREQRTFRHPAAEYAEAISTVLADGRLPAGALEGMRHSEADVLGWLRRLGDELRADANPSPSTPGM